MEMKRKIAKAIHESLGYETPWGSCTQCEDAANAVLGALMEPTREMMDEGVEPYMSENVRDSSVNSKCGRIFVRMIQAAKDGN